MKFFIESVTTYATSGKTRKGSIIQAAAKPFEHVELSDESTLKEFVSRLRALVRVCNSNYRGSTLALSWIRNGDSGQISVHSPKTGSEQNVVTISYAPIKRHLFDLTVFPVIGEVIRKQAPEIYQKVMMKSSEGGES